MKIDISKEYVRHLKQMNMLNIFDFKEQWDHAFFKSVIQSQAVENKDEAVSDDFEKIDKLLEHDLIEKSESMIAKGMNSAIDPKYISFLSNKQEMQIPRLPVQIKQNKKIISIWLEAKEQIDAELRNARIRTTE